MRHATTGVANAGVELRITDDDGRVLDPGAAGELEMRGYAVTPGYLGNDAANARSFRADGWYRTGDLAVIDADGNVAITGRDRDIINRGSIKINPTDVESLLARHPAIILAAIVPMPGAQLDPADLRTRLRRSLSGYKVPRHFFLMESRDLPLTNTGKIDKRALIQELTERLEREA